MATFTSASLAVCFSTDMLAAFDEFNQSSPSREDVIVKVGIHAGPCIAVTLKERLDYCGRTVNLAAGVQGLSEGRDVVITEELAQHPDIGSLLDGLAWRRESFRAALKGIAGAHPVVRLRPAT